MNFTVGGRPVRARLMDVDNDRPKPLWSTDVEGDLTRYYIEGVPTEGFSRQQLRAAFIRTVERDLESSDQSNTTSRNPRAIAP